MRPRPSRRASSGGLSPPRYWLTSHPGDNTRNIRFDVVLVVPGRIPRHIPAAFDASV
jgi:Holliday junction resolvase-like predicted endonuclease